ncbi:DUF6531 domain-containing protein [Kineococcus sp. NBC_00420]|uniref:DUF6531 domain-containing protein n=1 Tax=Kineococcus sp. NBC_00420 TaxID=2903564 RepID=UPI002E1BEE4D
MDSFSVDVGYINNPGSTTVTAYSASGAVLESSAIQQTGIVTVTVNQPGTASFTVGATSSEDAGFAVDNVSFLGYPGSPIGGNTTPNSANAPTVAEQGSAPNPSEHTTTCGAADPVNCATGYFFETDVDAAVPGRGVPLAFARTYDSASNYTPGRLGWGWQDSYNMSLDIYDVPVEGGDLGGQAAADAGGQAAANAGGGAGDAGAQVQGAKNGAAQLLDGVAVGGGETQTQRTVWVNQENGSTVTFTRQADGTYTAPSRVRASLVENPDGSFTFTRRPSQQSWTFDRNGRLTQQGTVDGYKTVLGYDDAGRLSKVSDPTGRSLVFGYTDSVNNVGATVAGTVITSVTDPAGRVTKYGYDEDGNLAKVTDAAGGVWGYGYNSSHLITSMTDPNGGVTTNVYDTRNRVVEQVSPAKQKTTWEYNGDPATDAGATNKVWGPHGDVTTHVYKNMQLVRLTRATDTDLQVSTSFSYDPTTLGMTSQVDALGRVTTHTYDARGNLTSTTDPGENTVAFTYDANDRQTSTTSPLGAVTKSSYDAAGRLLSATDAAGAVSTYEHGDTAHPEDITKVTDATGHSVRNTYAATGEVIATTSDIPGSTATRTWGFDIVG